MNNIFCLLLQRRLCMKKIISAFIFCLMTFFTGSNAHAMIDESQVALGGITPLSS